MNKLQKAGNKVTERILSLAESEVRFDYGALDMIEETVREVCIEYARSITSDIVEVYLREKKMNHYEITPYYLKVKEMLSRIDQDHQSLNN